MLGNQAYILSSPPRSIPLPVRIQVLFGGFVNQFGWFFFGFGMIFFWAFAMQADVSPLYFGGGVRTAAGRIESVERTAFAQGGNGDGMPVYAYSYRFTSQDGRTHTGVSYAVGRWHEPGAEVTIEYLERDHSVSRVKGMWRKPVPVWVLLVCIFPLIGLLLVVVGLVNGIRSIRLLRNGRLSYGTLKSAEPMASEGEEYPVFRLSFEFLAEDLRTYEVVSEGRPAPEPEEEKQKPVLYDPAKPSNAAMLDSLPGSPWIDPSGNIRARNPSVALAMILIPAATVIGHGVYAYLKFFR